MPPLDFDGRTIGPALTARQSPSARYRENDVNLVPPQARGTPPPSAIGMVWVDRARARTDSQALVGTVHPRSPTTRTAGAIRRSTVLPTQRVRRPPSSRRAALHATRIASSVGTRSPTAAVTPSTEVAASPSVRATSPSTRCGAPTSSSPRTASPSCARMPRSAIRAPSTASCTPSGPERRSETTRRSNVTQMAYMFLQAEDFNQDLSQWCVEKIESAPFAFDAGAYSWSKARPVWGTCPSRAPAH
jgi:hypothetical protein